MFDHFQAPEPTRHRAVRHGGVLGQIVAPFHASHLLQHPRDHHHRGGRWSRRARARQTSNAKDRTSHEPYPSPTQSLL